ncbi:superinfection immunity protein (plasmid) [Rhizobium sp. TH2]|nr:superinfection immunity protein [Rhizobium sp. TH2]
MPSNVFAQSTSPTFLQENRLAIAIMIFLYLLPSWIAWSRKHPSKGSIIAVNILLGWSVAGWIWALIWSLGTTKHNIAVVSPSTVTTQQSVPAASPATNKSVAERISELKAMLDSGTINLMEFEALKADAMKGLV